MRREQRIIASTHVDLDNEALAEEGIKFMADAINQSLVPIWIQHDPRIPPVGRIIRGEVRELTDGHLGVQAEMELFEPGDKIQFIADRHMPQERPEGEGLFIHYDRSLENEEGQQILDQIASVVKCKPQLEVRKSLDPITIFTVGGSFVLGAIASGFLGEIGTDGYNLLKKKLKDLFRRAPKNAERDSLLIFRAFVRDSRGTVQVDIILSNPSDEDIERFFQFGLQRLEQMLPPLLEKRESIQRMVFEANGLKLEVKYGVRSDAAPVFPVFAKEPKAPNGA
jgi:hypothetical protein